MRAGLRLAGGMAMYLIRADGNAQIGAGHLMRCLTIADALPEKKQVYFLCADNQSAELARSRGYRAAAFGTDYRRPEEELPLWEAGEWTAEGKSRNAILADSYYVTPRYLKTLQRYGRVALLEDLGRQAFPVDLVVNYNVFAKEGQYRRLYQGSGTEYCLGGNYIPIRPQFTGGVYRVRETVENVLITAGGGDAGNIAGKILDRIYNEKINYHLIIGRYNPHYQMMKSLEAQQKGVYIYHDVSDMASLMRRCDIAITAAGTTLYELAAVGVPFICFSYAENQEQLAEYVEQTGIACCGGRYHEEPYRTLEGIANAVCELTGDFQKRNRCYLKETGLVDGHGAERIAAALTQIMGVAE